MSDTAPTDGETKRAIVIGGGLAGMTAALNLKKLGYKVFLYEEKGMLGGNVASREIVRKKDGESFYYDVYPHMYQPWYRNFWQLMKEIGLQMAEIEEEPQNEGETGGKERGFNGFRPFRTFYQLRPREKQETEDPCDPELRSR